MKTGDTVTVKAEKCICKKYHGATGVAQKSREIVNRNGKQPIEYYVKFTKFAPYRFEVDRVKGLWLEPKYLV